MTGQNVIEVKNISKKFKIYLDKGHNLRDHALTRHRGRYEDRIVLQDISFSVKRGEAVGLIGENGSGKSTMLKLLTGIMYPDSGNIIMDGRVSALIELGAGFHPDMTGRENIYTNAAIFGLSRKEIDARLDEIIAFSELGAYIDNPVRTYSSGMYMRLAFSVAINVDADILLVDEILAVGDAAFQTKCFNRMREIKASGTTIVLVSHSMGQVEQLCDRCIWINHGHIEAEGNPRDVTRSYLEYSSCKLEPLISTVQPDETLPVEVQEHVLVMADAPEESGEVEVASVKEKNRWGNGDIVITSVEMRNEAGEFSTAFKVGGPIDILVRYKVVRPVRNANFGVGFFGKDGSNYYGTNTTIDGINTGLVDHDGEYRFRVKSCPLMMGTYFLAVAVSNQDGFDCDYIKNAVEFSTYSSLSHNGEVFLEHAWELSQ